MSEVDWDLWAVVRSCNKPTTAAAAAASTTTTNTQQSSIPPPTLDEIQNDNHDPFGLLGTTSNGFDELYEACKPFLTHLQPSISNATNIVDDHKCDKASQAAPQPQKLKRRRPKQRGKRGEAAMVVNVAAEGVGSMDPWCWRKYGQKPIKGSPNPRLYYKCSSDEGNKYCPAKKYVEQSQSNPEEYIVSYYGHHTHHHNHRKPPFSGCAGKKISAANNIVKATCTWASSLDTIKEDYEAEQGHDYEQHAVEEFLQFHPRVRKKPT